jgi:lipoprotein signal peptidase
MKTKSEVILFISAIMFSMIGQLSWEIMGREVYYLSIASLTLSLILIIHKNTKGWLKYITSIALFIAINNLIDEIFFDPTKFSWNEIFTIIVYIIHTITKKYTNERVC